ncbi:MAG: hypothetical protein ACRCSK_07035 [Fusobacteriaceae bacterium]
MRKILLVVAFIFFVIPTKIIAAAPTKENAITWDLTRIYSGAGGWNKDFSKAKVLIDKLPLYAGKISLTPQNLIEYLKLRDDILKLSERMNLYTTLILEADNKNKVALEQEQKLKNLDTDFKAKNSWAVDEILSVDRVVMDDWTHKFAADLKQYRFYLVDLYRTRNHMIYSEEAEMLLNFAGVEDSIDRIYDTIKSEIKYNKIILKNDKTKKEITVNDLEYKKILQTNYNHDDRKNAFVAIKNSYLTLKKTIAEVYRLILSRDIAKAKLLNYDSTLVATLWADNIQPEVYMNLINSAKKNTAPFQKYIALRKKYLKIKDYHFYDNFIQMNDFQKKYSYTEAKKLILESVSPLGKTYVEKIFFAMLDQNTEAYPRENKTSTYSFTAGAYNIPPFMFLNYTGTLESFRTMAHEYGHLGHFIMSDKYQPFITSVPSELSADVAASFNEKLLFDYIIKTSKDKKERLAMIEQKLSAIANIYYMKSMAADFEYQTYKIVESGELLTEEKMDSIVENLFKIYFGKEMILDPELKSEWLSTFFISSFYSYQQPISYAASLNIYDRIINNSYSEEYRDKSLEDYLKFLRSGGDDYPQNQLLKMGIDLTQTRNFDEVAKEFDRLLIAYEAEMKKK